MATMNPFDLLGDDAEDPSQLIVAEQQKVASAPKKTPAQDQGKPAARVLAQQNKPAARVLAQQNKPAQLPTKPPPPSQAVRESRNEISRGGRGGGRGGGRARGGSSFYRHSSNDGNSFAAGAFAGQGALEGGENGKPSERRGYGGPRGPHRDGRHGGFSNGEVGEDGHPRRVFERRSGTAHGNEFKRDGAGRGNWGSHTDEFAQVSDDVPNESEKNLGGERPAVEEDVVDANKESPTNEAEEKEPEDKEMTLEEYEKVLEEKRKALQALKTEERKVDTKEFETMQQLSSKKGHDGVFIKLGSDKDKRKEAFEKEEKSRKSVSINEFLKPAETGRYYSPGGRGRGRGRGSRGGYSGNATNNLPAPSIEDPGQFPTLGAK